MCQVNPRRLNPSTATNGQVPIWNDTTKRWEAGTPGSGFDPTQDQTITGTWNFAEPIFLVKTPTIPEPSDGVAIYSEDDALFNIAIPGGFNAAFNLQDITSNREYRLPDVNGVIALTSQLPTTTGLLKTALPIDTTLRTVQDYAGTNTPLQLSTTNAAITASGVNGLIIDQDTSSATLSTRLFFRNNTQLFAIGLSGSELTFRRGAVLNSSSGTVILKYGSTGVTIGADITNSAMLHVRGDATNPIFRFENNSASAFFQMSANSSTTLYSNLNSGSEAFRVLEGANLTFTSGTYNGFNYSMISAFAPASGSANFRPLSISYTLNATGANTATATGIFLNATETNLNGMTHNLMDLQVGGSSRFSVSNGGWVRANSFMSINNQNVTMASYGNGQLTLFDNTFVTFNRINFGGTTNAFPAVKRNGTELQVRLADDSGYAIADIGQLKNFGSTTFDGGTWYFTQITMANSATNIQQNNGVTYRLGINGLTIGANANPNASSILELSSTTKGFLPPRMTTAQGDAISSPAQGLQYFDTSLRATRIHNGSGWFTHLPFKQFNSGEGAITQNGTLEFSYNSKTYKINAQEI